MQYIMFGIDVCVLHNFGMANWCKFHNLYFSVCKYLCVTKKTILVNIQSQKSLKIVDCTFVL
jgi:hypothetical protein